MKKQEVMEIIEKPWQMATASCAWNLPGDGVTFCRLVAALGSEKAVMTRGNESSFVSSGWPQLPMPITRSARLKKG